MKIFSVSAKHCDPDPHISDRDGHVVPDGTVAGIFGDSALCGAVNRAVFVWKTDFSAPEIIHPCA